MDFDTFVITGPQTSSVSLAKLAGKKFNYAGACQTDVFSVSGTTVPPLCDTLTGEHGKYETLLFNWDALMKNSHIIVYFNADDDCHNLDFSFGQAANGNSKPSSRKFSIKVCIYNLHSSSRVDALNNIRTNIFSNCCKFD